MARRGYKVDVFEKRPDIRTMKVVSGKSINLTLSCRGIEALKYVGLDETVTKCCIPMHARMIHDLDGKQSPIMYGTKDQYIMSIDRRVLNEIMLSAAEKFPNVEMHFSHKLTTCNFETGEATFDNLEMTIRKHIFKCEQGQKVSKLFDLIIGCDGAYSAVRKQMMKLSRFDYQQTYIPHGYMELKILPNSRNEFAMEKNYLHIWPRHEYMMIAMPNLDKSFTTTLIMPFEMFKSITTEEQLIQFFKAEFPDALPLIGQQSLIETFMSRKALPFITIKCHPYHVNGKAVLLGDAAHAMVPFYGQGINCGMEDCIILNELLDLYNNDFSKVLPAYTNKRNPDAKAICDLAMYNYIEMRSKVNTTSFLIRKNLDNLLFKIFPKTWVPLYTMVSFTRIGYQEAIQRREWQDKILTRCLAVLAISGIVGLGVVMNQLGQNYKNWSVIVQSIMIKYGFVY
ncbi:kynurenine 3-monooxygenase [Biomphalaria pfeifferi]|uniref:Kynurenine 3-monooxygenase n=1 Tax=Biomphalaria pfeifferi TaxID=112525 RepID=A0AAD8B2W4_BIOPF|nr:kynurenine 3-monooxygenase [Biomphalaria pfeifferi]